jgi:diaminopimelate epimerase
MNLYFKKMSGAGNDFIVIDNRDGKIRYANRLARRLCDRRWSIGADGLILVEKSKKANYRMSYYNADGSYGGMCGNGGRCVALYSASKGITRNKHTFEALNDIYHATVNKKFVTLRMKNPKDIALNLSLPTSYGKIQGHYVDTGAPHVVIEATQFKHRFRRLQDLPVTELGREIRNHDKFHPKGTNVNFIQILSTNSIQMRTFERGVEDETLACGTGAIASAIVCNLAFGLKSQIKVITRSNRTLRVAFQKKGNQISDVSLKGPALVTFEGHINV